MGYACCYIWRCYAILVRHSVILGMLYILVLCYLLCNIGYCGRFIDVIFRKCFGFEFEFSCIWFEEFGKSFKENVLGWG